MFNQEFFLTPKLVINRMISQIKTWGSPILDPSAGKGDILDVLSDDSKRSRSQKSFYAIERDRT